MSIDIDLLKRFEKSNLKINDYITFQNKISLNVREILIDWIIQIHYIENLNLEVLFLAIYILDRYVSSEKISIERFQLIGITAYWIAIKYEEDNFLSLNKIMYYIEECYTREDILLMEKKVLNVIRFELSVSTVITFVHEMCNYFNSKSNKYKSVIFYLSELSLLYYDMLKYLPSIRCCSIFYITNLQLECERDNIELCEMFNYDINDLELCINDIYEAINNLKTKSVLDKYSTDEYSNVSKIRFDKKKFELSIDVKKNLLN
jgi:hypothetical protein